MPEALPPPVNSEVNDLQPAFTATGDTLDFASDRDVARGISIFRSWRTEGVWSEPEMVLSGIVGEPCPSRDGKRLYFDHVLSDSGGIFDADVWVCER